MFPQAAHQLAVGFVAEIADDAFGNHRPDAVDLQQVVERSGSQRVHALEVPGQRFGRNFPHETDAKREDHALERHLCGIGNGTHYLLCRLLAPAVGTVYLFHPYVVEVGHVVYQSAPVIFIHRFRSKTVDVHGFPADKVLYAPLDLRGACRVVGAIPCRLTLVADQFGATFRTMGDEFRLGTGFRPARFLVHTHDFRDDFPTLFHVHHVTDMQVQLGHHVGIVQRCAAHHRPGQLHGFHVRHGRDSPGAPHLEGHGVQPRSGPFGLEFVSDGPAGALGRVAQGALLPL